MSKITKLSQPFKIGDLELKNRIVVSSMTRNRNVDTLPTDIVKEYYIQRCNAGLILSEGIFVTPLGSEWPSAPGLWAANQVKAWKAVTDAIHENGSAIFAQLWHIGRVAHPLHQSGQPALSPSGIPAKGGKFRLLTGEPGYVSNPAPIEDPWEIVELYRTAAVNAFKAGFDGIELHAANGYLPHQFLEAHSNQRTDEWGGSPEKRSKFILEIMKVFVTVAGDSKKVGIKISPCGGYNDMGDPENVLIEEYTYLVKELDKMNLGYIQLVRHTPSFDPTGRGTKVEVFETFAPLIKSAEIIGNGELTAEIAEEYISKGLLNAAAFGRPYVNNPDYAIRVFQGLPLDNNIDWMRLYFSKDGEAWSEGYTNYKTATA